MPKLKLFLLGTPKFELDGRPVEIARRKAVALLAYLAVNGQAYTRDELATLFWPDYEPSQSYAYLRRTIWEINKVLGKGWLASGREQVELSGSQAMWLDVAAFEAALASAGSDQEPAEDMETLAKAVSLYRGEFMAGFTLSDAPQFDMWQRFTGERLGRQMMQALEALVAGYEERADYQQALTYAERWLTLDPLHEPAHRAVMRLYAASGQRAAAIRQYESLVAILEDELAVAPEAQTTDLHEQIARGEWPADDAREMDKDTQEAAARSKPGRQTVRLPVQPTRFVGRVDEIETISSLLTEPSCHLLSLTGPGGSGKTRLAIRVTEQLVEQKHPAVSDGAYFVSLAPLVSSDSIGPAIGKSLGGDFYREGQEPWQQLIDYLRRKRLLLILDNFEHLLGEEAVEILRELMGQLAYLKMLVTSRTRLNVRGEHQYRVVGMKAPDGRKGDGPADGRTPIGLAEAQSYSALRLFVQSAQMVQPGFELTLENLPAVARICRAVEGMPLAIELAAGWIELLPPADIADEIERGLDFLETESVDVPGRQRSIRAVFDYSWRLLDAGERNIMQRLSVFRGGFDRQVAEQVAGATLRQLLSLSNKSWLQQEEAGRYQIHELLRQYASEILQTNPAAWQQANDDHAAYYAEMLGAAGRDMQGPEQRAATEKVGAEFDNIGAAWRWNVQQGRLAILTQQMLPALHRYAFTRSTGEELLSLIQIASRALDPAQTGPVDSEEAAILLTYEIQARLLISVWHSYQEMTLRAWSFVEQRGGIDHYAYWLVFLATTYAWQVDHEAGVRWLAWLADEAQRTGEQWGSAAANLFLADVLQAGGHHARAVRASIRARQMFKKLGDISMEAHALRRLGSLLWIMGQYERAEQLLLTGRELFRSVANRGGEAEIVHELHELSLITGEFDKASIYFAERREIARALDQRRMVYESLHWESMQAVRFGDLEHARALRLESLELASVLDDPVLTAWSMWEMGELLRVEGDLTAARQWYSDALDGFQQTDQLLGIAFYNRGLGDLALSNGDYEDARQRFEFCLHLAEDEGHMWSVAYALSGLGRADVALGDLDRAKQQFRRSFQQAYLVSRDLCMLSLYGIASVLAASGKLARAIELAAFVAHYHLSWHETRRLAQALIAETRDRLAEEMADAAIERGRQRDLDSVIVDYKLEAKGAADE